jgi:RND family efflux transporter MFP subunit
MHRLFIFISILFLFSCKSDNEKPDEEKLSQPYERKVPVVEWLTTGLQTWEYQMLAQGNLQARQKAELRFKINGLLHRVLVKNGDFVHKGQLLAVLDSQELAHHYSAAYNEWQRAAAERYILLLERAESGDTASVSKEKKMLVDLRSGYSAAAIKLKEAAYNLNQTKLLAPFSGKIANLFIQNHNYISPSDIFCMLIDDSEFFIDFKLLEKEVALLKKDMAAEAVSVMQNGIALQGLISGINPMVEESGLVVVRAVFGSKKALFDGMQMQVVVKTTLPGQIVVPKEALLERSGKKVAFVAQNGLAKWKYVEIDGENATSFRLISGLASGDTLITSNNFNLVHDSEIKLKK